MPDPDIRDRVVGTVLGLALGDALGAPFEFERSASIPDPLPVLEMPWRALPAGSTTDDTAMARNLVRSLVACGGLRRQELVERHVDWLRTDPPDVGNLTRRVLARVAAGEDASTAARLDWEQRGPEVSAGNGSVMYCAPLGAAYAARPRSELREAADALSGLTHHDGRCRMAVIAITSVVADLVAGVDVGSAIADALRAVEGHDGAEELEHLVEAIGSSRTIDGPDQGFCLFTAGVGLQAVSRGGGAEQELPRVVSMGGDTDTNAAVAGALIGARDGRTGLPVGWLDRLVDLEEISAEAESLADLAER